MIEKKILLQVNATIIAGLLILLTIQAITAGGIPFLLELSASRDSIVMYQKAMNDTSTDPILLDAMKKRHAELKLEVMEKELRLSIAPDLWLIELLLNPVATFTFSMLFFLASMAQEMYHREETASKLGIALSYGGFFVMFIAVLFMVILPAV